MICMNLYGFEVLTDKIDKRIFDVCNVTGYNFRERRIKICPENQLIPEQSF